MNISQSCVLTFVVEVFTGSVDCFDVAREEVLLALSRHHLLVDAVPEPVLGPEKCNSRCVPGSRRGCQFRVNRLVLES